MGGAYVFPGGKLDDEDCSAGLVRRLVGLVHSELGTSLGESGPSDRLAGLFVAAIRETLEEAGILLAQSDSVLDPEAIREELSTGKSFADVCRDYDLRLEGGGLVPQARWITPEVEPRRYDTRFFLAKAPAAQSGSHDQLETTDATWLSPAEALALESEGKIQLPPPTLRTIQVLGEFETADAALEHTRNQPTPTIEPHVSTEEDRIILALPGDPLHSIDTPAFPGPTRIVLEGGRWWSRNAE